MTEELKCVNCGCGGEAVIDQIEGYDEYCVYCPKCFMQSGTYNTEAEAVGAWNTAMSGVVYPCTTPNSVYTSGCTITNTTDDKDDFHPVYDCMVGKERTAKVLKHKYRISVSLNVVGEPTIGYEWICENCKKKVIDGDEYCSHCGAKLEWNYE